jgi:hypothetical protein
LLLSCSESLFWILVRRFMQPGLKQNSSPFTTSWIKHQNGTFIRVKKKRAKICFCSFCHLCSPFTTCDPEHCIGFRTLFATWLALFFWKVWTHRIFVASDAWRMTEARKMETVIHINKNVTRLNNFISYLSIFTWQRQRYIYGYLVGSTISAPSGKIIRNS